MKEQIRMIRFLQKYAGKWHTFAKDQQTIEIVCALHNLGIAKVKDGMMTLKSHVKAKQFLAART